MKTDIVILTYADDNLDWLKALGDMQRFACVAVKAKRIVCGILKCEEPIVCRLNGDAIGLYATMVLLFPTFGGASDTERIGDLHVNFGVVSDFSAARLWRCDSPKQR